MKIRIKNNAILEIGNSKMTFIFLFSILFIAIFFLCIFIGCKTNNDVFLNELFEILENKKIIIVSNTVIAMVFLYFHPTKEVMQCGTDYICRVNRTYFEIFNTNKKIKLKPNSKLSCNVLVYGQTSKYHSDYGLYVKFDNITPFVYYVENYDLMPLNDLKNQCSSYENQFDRYLHGYHDTFEIKSKANFDELNDKSLMLVFILFFLYFPFVIGKICNR